MVVLVYSYSALHLQEMSWAEWAGVLPAQLFSLLLSGGGQGRLQPLACPVPSAKRGRASNGNWDIKTLPVSRVGTGEKGLDVLVSFWITPVRIKLNKIAKCVCHH